ncbi:MAG: hypothetical protein HKP23_06675 [Flavobacteriaceae bacterium]|nr:hypothetical protein [Eudoraea sp.]NNJ38906.1 hypothetical protein [Flavobacteriaceae bacterium]
MGIYSSLGHSPGSKDCQPVCGLNSRIGSRFGYCYVYFTGNFMAGLCLGQQAQNHQAAFISWRMLLDPILLDYAPGFFQGVFAGFGFLAIGSHQNKAESFLLAYFNNSERNLIPVVYPVHNPVDNFQIA